MRVNHSSGKPNYKKSNGQQKQKYPQEEKVMVNNIVNHNISHSSDKLPTVMVNYIVNHNISHSSDKLRTVMTNYMANKWPS